MDVSRIDLQVQHFSASEPFFAGMDAHPASFGLWHTAPVGAQSGWALLGDLSKWVPTASQRIVSVDDAAAGLTVGIVGSPGEVVTLHFANAAKLGAEQASRPAAARNYTTHARSYCDDGKPGSHTHAYESDSDSFEQCAAHCDRLSCGCFDYKTKHDGEGGRQGGEHMYRCRVDTVPTTLTHSGGGYSAYTPPPPPPVPPPPPPPQLATVSVRCEIGHSGSAKASVPAGTCA